MSSHALLRQAAMLAVLALPVGAADAALINGDFSTGFDGWSGQVFDGTATVDIDPLPGSYADNFSVDPNGATLITTFDTNGTSDVYLFQQFVVDAMEPKSIGLALLFDLDYDVDDDAVELFAQLSDPNGVLPTLSLAAGAPVDITAYAGRTAEVLFGVSNLFGADDSLTVADIRIEQVPAPAPLALFAAGLGLLAGRRRLVSEHAADQE